MDIKCPQHNLLLTTEKTTLRISGTEYSCVIGSCPQCATRYINRQLFSSCSTLNVDGISYQYLKKMHTAFPVSQKSVDAEASARKQAEEQRVFKAREASILEAKERIITGVYKAYHTKEICYVKGIPTTCPKDGDDIFDVKKACIYIQGAEIKTAAHCCIRCGTAYILEKRKAKLMKKVAGEEPQIPVPDKEDETSTSNTTTHLLAPASTILEARIRKLGEKNTQTVMVVTSFEEQSSKEGIYWVGRSMPAAILYAIHTDPKCRFEHKGVQYEVVSYKGSADLYKYLRIISRFCDPAAPRTIHVFAHKSISSFQNDDYEAVTAMIPCADRAFPVATTVYYEKKTSRYFMNEEQYKGLRDRYGLPHLRLRAAGEVVSFGDGFAELKPNSELNLLGYNVNASEGLTTDERRKKLGDIIDSGVLRKVEVMNHIEWCIKSHKNILNHENAVSKWREDLLFVQKYKMDAQRIVWIKNIQSQYTTSKPL